MGSGATVIDDWAGARGQRWLRDVDVMEAMLAPIGSAALDHAAHAAGERVLDIGCGGGWTTRQIGAAVGPTGLALGLDISAELVDEAGRRAAAIPQVRFEAGDAAELVPAGGPFDRLFSRFGVMFFADPTAAFRHMGSQLKPGARLDLAVWANPQWNRWRPARFSWLTPTFTGRCWKRRVSRALRAGCWSFRSCLAAPARRLLLLLPLRSGPFRSGSSPKPPGRVCWRL
jgi:ubiquinone/menaquinone biosynthesis C-methylase UbiE